MAVEKKHFIVLPTGRKLQIITQSPIDLDNVRKLMSEASAVTLDVGFEDEHMGQLILWGDVLKNSYLEVR